MTSNLPYTIESSGLVKTLGEVRAVDGIDLAVPAGGVYGLLGPNGTGKTTLTRILATLLAPDAGSGHVLGHDLVREADAVRRRIALTGQHASVDDDLTGRENLVLNARLLGYGRAEARRRATELLGVVKLSDAADRQVRKYSGGMRRRLDIAASLVVRPDLLFLDEPTTGLDPRSRSQLWDIVRTLVAAGTTVVLTTQYLDEADRLADRIGVIDHGRLIAEGTPGELKAAVGTGVLHVRVADPDQRPETERALALALDADVHLAADASALTARVTDPDRVAPALVELSHAGIGVREYALGQPSLDEVFLALTGRTDGTSRPTPPDRSATTHDKDAA